MVEMGDTATAYMYLPLFWPNETMTPFLKPLR